MGRAMKPSAGGSMQLHLLLCLLLLDLFSAVTATRWAQHREPDHAHHAHGRHRRKDESENVRPQFDPRSPTTITAQYGSTAYLPCKILDLGDKSVSWVRNRDAHIVSVDRYTFISDARFVAWHEAQTETWTLQIKFVGAMDAGRYECQVSTEPKMSHFVHLNVITPRVSIAGGSELHVRSGSTVTIRCVVSHALHPPTHVFWYHEDTRVPEGAWRGVQQTPLTNVSGEASEAALTITSVAQHHAGNYTCAPAALIPVSATLHVLLDGERPAAMQRDASAGSQGTHQHLLLVLLTCLLSCWSFLLPLPLLR